CNRLRIVKGMHWVPGAGFLGPGEAGPPADTPSATPRNRRYPRPQGLVTHGHDAGSRKADRGPPQWRAPRGRQPALRLQTTTPRRRPDRDARVDRGARRRRAPFRARAGGLPAAEGAEARPHAAGRIAGARPVPLHQYDLTGTGVRVPRRRDDGAADP